MTVSIREMTIDDYDEVFALWQVSEGVGLSTADERDEIAIYLHRNPGTSFVALDGGQLVAAVLCGHDGRRGYIHHLAVKKSHRPFSPMAGKKSSASYAPSITADSRHMSG